MLRNKCVQLLICVLVAWPTLGQATERIVSLKPNLTELIYALGAGDHMVGVTTWCNHPAAAQQLPKIADYVTPNIEAVLALAPTLIVASQENSTKAPVQRLEQLGVPVQLYATDNFKTLFTTITTLGAALQRPQAAATLRKTLERETNLPPVSGRSIRVLAIVGNAPLIAVGPTSFIGEVISRAGGTHVLKSPNRSYPRVDPEWILAQSVDLILDLRMGSERSTHTKITDLIPQWPQAKPVHIVRLPTDLFLAGPRVGQAVAAVRQAITQTTEPRS